MTGVRKEVLFQPDDLVEQRNVEQVVKCLMGLAEVGYRSFQLTTLPEIIQMQIAIDEVQPPPPTLAVFCPMPSAHAPGAGACSKSASHPTLTRPLAARPRSALPRRALRAGAG